MIYENNDDPACNLMIFTPGKVASIMEKLVYENLAVYLDISDDDAQKHVKKILKYKNFYFLDTSNEFPLRDEQNNEVFPIILDRFKTDMPISINKNEGYQQIQPALRKYEEIRGGFIFKK